MASQRPISIVHKNDLGAYLGDWKNVMNMMSGMKLDESQNYRVPRIPTPIESFSFDSHDLTVLLAYLHDSLTLLKETPLSEFNNRAYAEARVFLKTCLIIFPILLDDLSGIIGYFYKNNEKLVLKKSFDKLRKQSKNKGFPEDLSKLLEQTGSWFPEMKDTRDDLIHYYDSILLSFKEIEGDKNIIGHFHIKGRAPIAYEDTRKYLGLMFCEYQKLIDNLLDHFDTKFQGWYGIVQGKSGRTTTTLQGYAGLPLWWACKYGEYRHRDLVVNEDV
ncbi:hypothetical protein ACFLXU_05230 [Chloroflexota bacterium]